MLKRITTTLAILLSLAVMPHAHAATINVNCGGHEGFTSVNAAIKALANWNIGGANVINVRGVCNENVVFKNVSHITLDGGNNATIVDLTGGASPAISLDSSQEIAINNLTASGTGQGSAPDQERFIRRRWAPKSIERTPGTRARCVDARADRGRQ